MQQTQDRRLRQAAAVHILRAAGLYGTNLAPSGATTPEGVQAAWEREAMDDLLGMPPLV